MKETHFLGQGWGFPPRFSANGAGVNMVSAEEDIRQALYILLFTQLGQRPMAPSFGTAIADYVFESPDGNTLAWLKEHIAGQVIALEPRVDLKNVDVALSFEQGQKLEIDLDYVVRDTNTRTNFVFPFYLTEYQGV
ncbi:GPW/gp25 family protein [Pseudoalteromonas sp. JBTF-M23]|uniref:GPW/gp25 family protein n=1 Tax=Pseudoalteromonas caenipelagi TaxID=2726988 RepID=A0A849VA99_9GAMM|nr:GPW/gp25 family protein [Pseudoalteromonas caenipelagi]NOU50549.1 GPW/gp25 family protein [Pseudoalteromonas caenipelagi]